MPSRDSGEGDAREVAADADWGAQPALGEVQAVLGDCERCGLAKTRNKIVFGDGNPNADLDGDGCVDLNDLATLLANYGTP